MASLRVLKVRCEAFTTSFRYPRIQAGSLRTFDMPPPATIYGHLAGVIGDWFDPSGLEFAYTFEHEGKGVDLETRQPIEAGSGKNSKAKSGWDFPVNVECTPNPQPREFLFRPRMTLYLKGSEQHVECFLRAFESPYFAYILGRSQDLAHCRSVRIVELQQSADVFFSHTLLPYSWRPWVLPGTSVIMPEVIDYRRKREARQQRYLQITSPALWVHPQTPDITARGSLPPDFPMDPEESRELSGRPVSRGLHFFPVQSTIV
jgi:CRISPR-associated protein Cas5t